MHHQLRKPGPLHGVTYANNETEPGDIEATAHLVGVKHKDNEAFARTLAGLPASGEGSNGTYIGNSSVRAYETGSGFGKQVGIVVG